MLRPPPTAFATASQARKPGWLTRPTRGRDRFYLFLRLFAISERAPKTRKTPPTNETAHQLKWRCLLLAAWAERVPMMTTPTAIAAGAMLRSRPPSPARSTHLSVIRVPTNSAPTDATRNNVVIVPSRGHTTAAAASPATDNKVLAAIRTTGHCLPVNRGSFVLRLRHTE